MILVHNASACIALHYSIHPYDIWIYDLHVSLFIAYYLTHLFIVTKSWTGPTKTFERSSNGFWYLQLVYLANISCQINRIYKEIGSKAKLTCSSGDWSDLANN